MFLDDFVLRHYNTTEAEKHYIKDTIIKANKFGSTKHYEEAYQNLINTFWSQIKYSLTSLQPCIYLKEDRDLIKNLLMSMLNFQENELTVEKEDIIGRVLHFLESAKVRQNNKYIFDVWKHSQCTVLKSTDSDFLEYQNASQQKFDLGICKNTQSSLTNLVYKDPTYILIAVANYLHPENQQKCPINSQPGNF